MNYKDHVIKRLVGYNRNQIVFSDHARIRIIQRQLDSEEIIENIINPKRLEYAIKEVTISNDEEKFDCYFGYSKNLCHRYILILKSNVLIITVIKLNRRWQAIAEKKLK
jgi:hypothetical protein